MAGVTLKPCVRCRALKPADQFAVDQRRSDGRSSICKPCKAEDQKARRARAKRGPADVVELRPGLQLVEYTSPVAEAKPQRRRTAGRHAEALEDALAAAPWIEAADAALVEYARSIARGMDAAEAAFEGDSDITVKPEPQYLAALKALRLDPASRHKASAAAEAPAIRTFDASGY
jgi:hypothetical protein